MKGVIVLLGPVVSGVDDYILGWVAKWTHLYANLPA
jgi:hypothetical protein